MNRGGWKRNTDERHLFLVGWVKIGARAGYLLFSLLSLPFCIHQTYYFCGGGQLIRHSIREMRDRDRDDDRDRER